MPRYQRVTLENRIEIKAYLELGLSKALIAQKLSLHKSTIYRELRRNFSGHSSAIRAHGFAKERFKRCRRLSVVRKLSLENEVIEKLSRGWSPEQIAGRIKREKRISVSYQSIYRFIRQTEMGILKLGSKLRRAGKRGPSRDRVRANFTVWMKRFKDRPAIINNRERIGDWERDTLNAKARKLLLVCVERKSKITKIKKLKTHHAHQTGLATIELLNEAGRPVYSLTNDNGPEFRDGYLFNIPIYYCKPQSPQQRGTVENMIGLLRQYIKRDTDLDAISESEIKELENKLNFRPRKCLDYKTPHEVFYETTVALVV